MGNRVPFLDRASHLRLGDSAKQLAYWWYYGCECWFGMGVFVEALGHNDHLSCVYAVASVLGVDIWRLDNFYILYLYVLSHCKFWQRQHSVKCTFGE
jgi:hypothetical protein